jgi:hypothetical protein
MITTLKLLTAGMLGWAVLNPGGFVPRASDCECKADAVTRLPQPRADDCECKADTALKQFKPRADDCECKAKAD